MQCALYREMGFISIVELIKWCNFVNISDKNQYVSSKLISCYTAHFYLFLPSSSNSLYSDILGLCF